MYKYKKKLNYNNNVQINKNNDLHDSLPPSAFFSGRLAIFQNVH